MTSIGVHVRIDKADVALLDSIAKSNGTTRSGEIQKCVRDRMEKYSANSFTEKTIELKILDGLKELSLDVQKIKKKMGV